MICFPLWRPIPTRVRRNSLFFNESGTDVSPVLSRSQDVSHVCFQPFDPRQPTQITERNLPHWQQEGTAYFVTFRLGDSLPQSKLKQWKEEREQWMRQNQPPWTEQQHRDYAERFPKRLNEWLDAGEGSCLLAQEKPAKIVEDALRHFDGERYLLDEFVIMPNHVHVIFLPMAGHNLSGILHSWKSFTSHTINKELNRKGNLWLDESFDHIVRSFEQLEFYRAYIRENPTKAKLRAGQFCAGTGTVPLQVKKNKDMGKESGTGVPPVLDKPNK